jgi:uncharacterized protein (UPF0332 family)
MPLPKLLAENFKQHALELMEYAELDFQQENYASAFLKSCTAIRLIGDAMLISKDVYAPSAKKLMTIMTLRFPSLGHVQKKLDKYAANPDKEIIERRDAKIALMEGKELLEEAKRISG